MLFHYIWSSPSGRYNQTTLQNHETSFACQTRCWYRCSHWLSYNFLVEFSFEQSETLRYKQHGHQNITLFECKKKPIICCKLRELRRHYLKGVVRISDGFHRLMTLETSSTEVRGTVHTQHGRHLVLTAVVTFHLTYIRNL